ncbi:hypothetical protein ACFVW8_00835 [Streptomyces sp. NPDC058221]|uniref:hypothetical protein n=1 Tax=Streptomyces sp. NPDC058221 TaxID=3346388 RepID=UPI0036ED2FDD
MSSDRFPRRGPDEEAEALLIRAAMEQATDGAPALPDLVPAALVQGRSRRVRARAAIGAGVTGVVALGVLGAVLPVWGGGGSVGAEPAGTWSAASRGARIPPSAVPSVPAAPVTTAPSWVAPTDSPLPSRLHIAPSPGQSSMADLPDAERVRQEGFQQEAAALLDKLLPPEFGPVRPVDLAVSRYQGGADGKAFPLVFSVRPMGTPGGGAAPGQPPCRDDLDKKVRCRTATLPGGIEARAVTTASRPRQSQSVTTTVVRFAYGDSSVALSVGGDTTTKTSPPVSVGELLGVAGNDRFLDLVKYADEHSMETKESAERVG